MFKVVCMVSGVNWATEFTVYKIDVNRVTQEIRFLIYDHIKKIWRFEDANNFRPIRDND